MEDLSAFQRGRALPPCLITSPRLRIRGPPALNRRDDRSSCDYSYEPKSVSSFSEIARQLSFQRLN
jgi:hypothetical protein